jgi:hypothetical protein
MPRKDAQVLQAIAEALWPSLPAEAEQARQSGDEVLAEYYSTAGFFDREGQSELVRDFETLACMSAQSAQVGRSIILGFTVLSTAPIACRPCS